MTRSEWALVLLLALIQWVHIMDFMIMMPMGPRLMDQFGVTPSQMAIAISIYSLAAGGIGLLGSYLMDRWSRRASVVTLAMVLGITTIACGTTLHFGVFLVLRGLAGMAGGALGGALFATLGDGVPAHYQGRATGIVMSGFSIAAIAGIPIGMMMANAWGCSVVFWAIGGIGLLAGAIAYGVMPTLPVQSDVTAWWQNMRLSWVNLNERHSLLTILTIAMAGFLIIPMINPYLIRNVGVAASVIPWVYAIGGLVTLGSNQWIGRLVDRWGHRRVLGYLLPLSVVPLFGITILPPIPMLGVIVSTTVFFVLVSGRFVPAMALIMGAVPSYRRGRFVSLASALQQLGAAFASLISSCLVHTTIGSGHLSGYASAGVVSLGMTILAIWLSRYADSSH